MKKRQSFRERTLERGKVLNSAGKKEESPGQLKTGKVFYWKGSERLVLEEGAVPSRPGRVVEKKKAWIVFLFAHSLGVGRDLWPEKGFNVQGAERNPLEEEVLTATRPIGVQEDC